MLCKLWVSAPRIFQDPRRLPRRWLERYPVIHVSPGQRVACPKRFDTSLEYHMTPGSTGSRAEIDNMVGNLDHFGLVLDHQNGVALVTQLEQQRVHSLDVVRVQSDRWLVEHVGHVGERRAEMADHLGSLSLASRQRSGRPVQRQIAQPDLGERVERLLERRQQRRCRLSIQRALPSRPGR